MGNGNVLFWPENNAVPQERPSSAADVRDIVQALADSPNRGAAPKKSNWWNTLQLLNELFPGLENSTVQTEPSFICRVTIKNQVFKGTGKTNKGARHAAAACAVEMLNL